MRYRQCLVQKDNVHQTTFLPEPFAVVGRRLQLKEHDQWVGGWVVRTAGELVEGKLIEGKAHNSASIGEPSAKLTSRGHK